MPQGNYAKNVQEISTISEAGGKSLGTFGNDFDEYDFFFEKCKNMCKECVKCAGYTKNMQLHTPLHSKRAFVFVGTHRNSEMDQEQSLGRSINKPFHVQSTVLFDFLWLHVGLESATQCEKKISYSFMC